MNQNIYRQQIIDHYKNPRNTGVIEGYDYTAEFSNTSCGDEIKVYIKLDNKGIIKDFSYEARGCAISIAASSILSEEIIGKKLEFITNSGKDYIETLIGTELTNSRIKCALLPIDALKKIQSEIASN